MRRKLVILSIVLMVVGEFVAHASENCIPQLNGVRKNPPIVSEGFSEKNGDLVSISTSNLTIYEKGYFYHFKLSSKALIYCNGLTASWKALLPVTPEVYFEARVIVNKSNEVIFLDGFYSGEESMIKGWSGDKDHLNLELTSLSNQKTKQYGIKRTAHLPKVNWLVVGQVVFVLYSSEGTIRAIYLPD